MHPIDPTPILHPMAEEGEWALKGATLSDVTVLKEYGVTRAFIIAGKLEYREGLLYDNPISGCW